MRPSIHILIDVEAMIGEKPDSKLARKLGSVILENIDPRWGSATVQEGKPEVGTVLVSVTNCETDAREYAIIRAVYRKVEYCMAAWDGEG
jgi:hypothetical protein